MTCRTTLLIAAAIVALIGVTALWFATSGLANLTRPLIENRLEALTGRDVTIEGAVTVTASLSPMVVARGVAIANAPWGSAPRMATLERIELQLQVMPWLRKRQVVVDRLHVRGGEILVERGPEGRLNWRFDTPANDRIVDGGPAPLLDEASIADSRVIWHDMASDTRETVFIDALQWTSAADQRMKLAGRGDWGDRPFALAGTLGSVAALAGSNGWPLSLSAEIGGATIGIDGAVGLGDGATRIEARLSGERLRALGDMIGVALPALGPYEGRAQIASGPAGLHAPAVEVRIGAPDWGVIEARGAVDSLAEGAVLALDITAQGESLAALGARLNVDLPALGPYALSGRLSGPIASTALSEIAGAAGARESLLLRVARGRIGRLDAFADVALPLAAETPSLANAGTALGLALPALGPAQASGTLAREAGPFALRDLSATAGTDVARLAIEGRIADVLSAPSLDLAVRSEGGSLAALGESLGVALAKPVPYRTEFQLSGQPTRLQVRDLRAQLVDSALAGAVQIDLAGATPSLRGQLSVERIDIAAIADAFAVEAPATEPGVLPVDALSALDAQLDLSAARIEIADVEIGPAQARIDLADGRLALRDIDLRAMGGAIRGGATVAPVSGPTGSAAAIEVTLQAEQLDLGRMLQVAGTEPAAELRLEAEVAATSTGRTVEELRAALNGEASVTSSGGILYETQLNRLIQDVDPLRFLLPFWQRAEAVNVNCLLGQMRIDAGVAATELLLDTRRMTVIGEGTINLRTGHLQLTLDPEPKSQALSAAGVPVEISGPLGSPSVEPRSGEAAGRLLRGLVGGLLVPLNQLVRVFGPRAESACGGVLEPTP